MSDEQMIERQTDAVAKAVQQHIDEAIKADRKRLADEIQRGITQWINIYGHPTSDYDAARIDTWRDMRMLLMREGR
jgi:hypothetical protein